MNDHEYKNIIENMFEGVYYVDKNRKILCWNKAAERITGFTAEEVMNRHCYDNILNHQDDAGNKLCMGGCPLHKTIQDLETRETKVHLHHKDGHRVTVSVKTFPIYDQGNCIGAAEVFTDDTERVNSLVNLEQLKQLAMYDQLTELPNRRYLESSINARMTEYITSGLSFGVLFIDIDHFKHFNDTYGHEVGDLVLKMISKTYMSGIRRTDMIGRWGGEEFLAIFPGVNEDVLARIAEKIRKLVEMSELRHENEGLKVTVSVGGAVIQEYDTVESLIKRADENMYLSKANGRNQVTIK